MFAFLYRVRIDVKFRIVIYFYFECKNEKVLFRENKNEIETIIF